ncbi:CarboxypepD_reg-like domain-containing protein [Pedobacter nyackensis]|uniref:CarboxypepD_reg-like domain-containing protein n=2 Tax=Pedobacter nyackensis TaxID=475255 RepID=A0A1W2D3D8_9SPHI|nr:CarboxypepD_reg-like domain-containing protein [Pedobacter nyackensis]
MFMMTLYGFSAFGQKTSVKGTVIDATTKETIPYASFIITGSGKGGKTDVNGQYNITIEGNYTQLKFSYIGYKSQLRTVKPGIAQTINVQLQSEAMQMNEVVIKAAKRPPYRNKNNPAVELIRNVIANKSKNRMESYDYVAYKKYERMLFSMSNLSDKFKSKKIFRNYQFLFQEQDSTKIGGKNLLPVFQQEKLSENYFRKNPEKMKTVVIADKQVNFDEKFVDNQGLSSYFDRMYQDIDIYDNNISVVSNLLLSPIADGAPTFYKFFITDTIKTEQPQLIELSFTPRGKMDMLFEGKLYVTMDGNYAVQNAYLTVNKSINLNFVRGLEAKLEFEQNPDKRYHLSKSNLIVDFGITKKSGTGFTGERTVTFKDYTINQPPVDSIYKTAAPLVVVPDATQKSDEFWASNRPEALSLSSNRVYHNLDTLQTIPSFKRTLDIVTLFFAGYKDFGPFEMGPVNTFYSFNSVEGFRARLGGRTTTALSKRYYFETYAAYGVEDKKWKYFLSGTYSLNNKSIYAFPQSYVRASFQRDTKIPGQELQFVQEDNFLLSFKRGENNMMLYNDFYRVDYVREFENHFSYTVGLRKWSQTPAGSLYFNNSSETLFSRTNQINTSEISVNLRYAPHERFYQGKVYRTPLVDKYPIFNLRYTAGLKGVLGGEYNYHNFMASADKRFYLSQFGYTDVTLEGGYNVGKLPFPLLSIHRANQTYAYQLQSYNLMNFLEFVSDHYASVNIDQNFNGFFFNKIPLIQHLKLREVMSFKAMYGGLRNENNPNKNTDAMQFVRNTDGQTITHALDNGPYIEGSVGVGNIFKILRVDAVKRFSYLDNPGVSDWGIRARVKFDF